MQTFAGALVATFLSLVNATTSTAGVCVPHQAEPNSVPQFLYALIDSLSYASAGRERAGSSTNVSADLMLNLKLADSEFECAGDQLAAYEASANKMIALSAKAARRVYSSIMELDQRLVIVLRDLLDRGPNDPRWGTVSEQVAQIGAEADDAWKLLPMAAVGATYAMLDPAQQGRLVLTAKDRAGLVTALEGQFGKEVRQGMRAGQQPVVAAAAALHSFISDQKWQSRPSNTN